MNTKIKIALHNTYKVLKILEERAWQFKLTLAAIVTASFVGCKNEKQEALQYRFPYRIDEVSGERSHITDIKYKISLFESNDNSICPMDSIVIFKKDGKILNSSKEIGYWKKGGTLYLKDFKKRFFFNWITPGNCKAVQLFSIYTIGNESEVKRVRIYAKSIQGEE